MTPRFRRQHSQFYDEVTEYLIDTEIRDLRLWAVPTPGSFGLNNASRNVDTIIRIAKAWHVKGWGILEGADKGWPIFKFNDAGMRAAKWHHQKLRLKRFILSFRSFNWTAIAAVIAAIASVASAYFAYMGLHD